MFDIVTNVFGSDNELADECKLFSAYGGGKVEISASDEGAFSCTVTYDGKTRSFVGDMATDVAPHDKLFKRFVKRSVYRTLSEHFGVTLPWGSLTGVRPTKLAYERMRAGGTVRDAVEYLVREYDVSRVKAEVIGRILEAQADAIASATGKADLYVHIPFCNGRCAYCSFPSADMARLGHLLPTYLKALEREIRAVKDMMARDGRAIHSVYVGGGTPSVLDAEQISSLLDVIGVRDTEFTFEAGRPDSISPEKLDALAEGGVTRVCVNPQSLNDATLTAIGRRHKAEDFFTAFDAVRKRNFDINVDIIAGLADEGMAEFSRTVDGVAALQPENLTVHTLSRKRGSDLAGSDPACADIARMTEYAAERLKDDYAPYYLYRQKYMAGNLENTGYALPGKICVNNITVMEEILPVYACGAGSISKNITSEGVITREASIKDVALYLERFDERLARKSEFFRAT